MNDCIDLELKVCLKVAKILGAPIWSSERDIVVLAAKIIKKYDILFERLQNKGLSNIAVYYILRKCGIPYINYLSIVVPPHLLHQTSVDFDKKTLNFFVTKHKIYMSELDQSALTQLSLPISK